jgi:hypothetical protein
MMKLLRARRVYLYFILLVFDVKDVVHLVSLALITLESTAPGSSYFVVRVESGLLLVNSTRPR